MSDRNGDVFQVLVTSGNQALLAAGAALDTLAPGQLGIFDASTHLAVATPVREFYMALGVDRTGSATLEDVKFSAGQLIQRANVSGFTYGAHTASRPMIVEVSNIAARCDRDYTLRIELRNSKIHRIQGTNQFSEAFTVRGACCPDCGDDDCSQADANDVAIKMTREINMNSGGRLSATMVGTVPGATPVVTPGLTADTVQAYLAANPTAVLSFRITAIAVPASQSSSINQHFHKLRQTTILVSLVEGFNCSGTVTTVQSLREEEGSGYNIREKEYMASAWDGAGPYVASELLGLAKENVIYTAVATGKYDQFVLEYSQKSESGWLNYENVLSTIVAIPEADTATRNAFATSMNAILTGLGFETLVDDAAAASTNPAVVEPDVTSVATDGIA